MAALPAWYPDPDERKPAPGPLLLVQAFLNTRDLEQHTDLLEAPTAARAWLVSAGLLARGASFAAADLELARAVRESIRSLLDRSERPHLDALRELTETHRPRLSVDAHGVFAVENERPETLADGLFGLLVTIQHSQEAGTWTRLKACANPDCGWVFYDRSRNQQGSWCEMAVCGNRLKNRTLRARRRLSA